MKMEHLRHLGIRDTNDPLVKTGHVMAGAVKFKLASIKRKYVETTELERAAAEKATEKAAALALADKAGNNDKTAGIALESSKAQAPKPTAEIMRRRTLTDEQFGLSKK